MANEHALGEIFDHGTLVITVTKVDASGRVQDRQQVVITADFQ